MMIVDFRGLMLCAALACSLAGQSTATGENPDLPDAPSIPGITRVLIRSEKLSSGSKFWVKNRNGDITVMGWDKEEMYMSAEIRDTDRRRVELNIQHREGGLAIETTFQQPFWSFDWGLVLSPRCEMTIFVPRRLVGDFRTTNGSLVITYLDGFAHCETTNGDVLVKDVSGEATAETRNGSIEGRDLDARIRAVTTNGQISLINVSGGIAAETINGNIRAKNMDGWGEGIVLTTTNGSIDISLGDATGDITAESTDGNLDIKIPDAKTMELSKQSAHLKIPGRTQKINLKTTNGTITIRE